MSAIAIVTGAGSGIGRALAAAMLRRGDTVVLADIDSSGLAEARESLALRAFNSRATTAVVDVRDPDTVAELISSTVEREGRLDLMFNNAGIGIGGELEELTLEHWNRIIDVNLMGVIHGVQAAYPVMVRQGYGHIINTASLSGLNPAPLLVPYSTTKHGVVGLSLALRAEAAANGVGVTVVCPGPTDTPFLDKGGPADLPRSRLRRHLDVRELTEASTEVYSAERLADDILRAIAQNKARVIAPRSARVAWRANRYVPWLVNRLSAQAATKVRGMVEDKIAAGEHA
jgi:NAD(P)-dependent dehydrogenase (short-subunit alcohol dehydrogenase family)